MKSRKTSAAVAVAVAVGIAMAGAAVAAACSTGTEQQEAPFEIRLSLREDFREPLSPNRNFVLMVELTYPLPPDGPEGLVAGEQILFDGVDYVSHEGYACIGVCPGTYGYTLRPAGEGTFTARVPALAVRDAYGRTNQTETLFSATIGATSPMARQPPDG